MRPKISCATTKMCSFCPLLRVCLSLSPRRCPLCHSPNVDCRPGRDVDVVRGARRHLLVDDGAVVLALLQLDDLLLQSAVLLLQRRVNENMLCNGPRFLKDGVHHCPLGLRSTQLTNKFCHKAIVYPGALVYPCIDYDTKHP